MTTSTSPAPMSPLYKAIDRLASVVFWTTTLALLVCLGHRLWAIAHQDATPEVSHAAVSDYVKAHDCVVAITGYGEVTLFRCDAWPSGKYLTLDDVRAAVREAQALAAVDASTPEASAK